MIKLHAAGMAASVTHRMQRSPHLETKCKQPSLDATPASFKRIGSAAFSVGRKQSLDFQQPPLPCPISLSASITTQVRLANPGGDTSSLEYVFAS